MKKGEIYEGKVVSIKEFGAFIEFCNWLNDTQFPDLPNKEPYVLNKLLEAAELLLSLLLGTKIDPNINTHSNTLHATR